MTKYELIKNMSEFELLGFKPIVDKTHPKEHHLYIVWEMGDRFQVYLHILSHARFDRDKCAIVRDYDKTTVILEIHCDCNIVKMDRVELSEIPDIETFKLQIISKVRSAIVKDIEELRNTLESNQNIIQGNIDYD